MAVIITARGSKVRSQSQRRFVVVAERVTAGGVGHAWIEKRSDSRATLETHVSRKGAFDGNSESAIVRSIHDTRKEA